MIAFEILERHGKVHTEIVPNAAKKPLQAAIQGQVDLNRIIHSDGGRGYDGLVDRGYKKLFRVNHGQHEFARGNCPINGIESFWSYAKRRLAKLGSGHGSESGRLGTGCKKQRLSQVLFINPLDNLPWRSLWSGCSGVNQSSPLREPVIEPGQVYGRDLNAMPLPCGGQVLTLGQQQVAVFQAVHVQAL